MYRLRLRKDIERVLRRGRSMESPLFRAVAAQNQVGHMRLALVVSRATAGRAVVRNRIRRRAREWVRTHPDILALPFDVALIFKKQAAVLARTLFYEELGRVFSSLRI